MTENLMQHRWILKRWLELLGLRLQDND